MTKPGMYWRKQVKRPDEDLKTLTAEIHKLTEEDKKDLDRWAEEEMKLLGIPITVS